MSLICVTATNSLCTAKGVLESAGILPPNTPTPWWGNVLPSRNKWAWNQHPEDDRRRDKRQRGTTDCGQHWTGLQNSRFFFSKSVRKSVKRGVRVLHARSSQASHACSVSPQSHSPFWASFQTFRLTTRAYLNTQKYGLFCSLALDIRFALISLPPACHLPRGW